MISLTAISLTAGMFALGSVARAQEPALDAAFQKEVAYLTAERRALQERLRAHDAEAARRLARAEAELGGQEARVLALERQADAVESRLEEMDTRVAAIDAARELVDSTVSQAGESLGVEVDAEAPAGARLDAVFSASAAALQRGRSLRTEEGAYFLADGTAARGEVVRLGEIAAWGVGSAGSGSLLPIEGGHLQLRAGGGGGGSAADLLGGRTAGAVDVFLLESLEKPVSERKAQTFEQYMAGGGVVGWVIALLGVLGLGLAAARAVLLVLAGRGGARSEAVTALVDRGDIVGARAAVHDGRTPTARVVRAVLGAPSRDRDALQDVATEAILGEVPNLERFGAAILVIAAVAPLLGLLGTVTGMIATFDIITEFGTGDPKMLSGGISEALITTQLGLVVAIPLVLLGNTLKSRADAVEARIERAALQMVNRLDGASAPEPPLPPAAAPAPASELPGARGTAPQVAHA